MIGLTSKVIFQGDRRRDLHAGLLSAIRQDEERITGLSMLGKAGNSCTILLAALIHCKIILN